MRKMDKNNNLHVESHNDDNSVVCFGDSYELPRNDKSFDSTRLKRGSSFRRFCGLRSCERGNKTDSLCHFAPLVDSCELTKRTTSLPQNRQRYNRASFGMMFAIIITIVVATLGVLAVRFSTQSLNTTTNEYIAIQLDLYLNSTAELAILYVQRNGFVCEENVNCDLGPNNISSGTKVGAGKRTNPMASIEKYVTYGPQGEYSFKYKITPLDNYDKYDARAYMQIDDITECEKQRAQSKLSQRCFKEETKNAFLLDISGSVTNPITNQTMRVTKRQIIKP